MPKKILLIISLIIASPLAQAATNCAAVTEIPSTECEILITLYNTTGGDNWTDNTGWNVTNTPCSWYGVICNGGHVEKLDLSYNQLSGTIPAELGQLSYLENLTLTDNQLSGTIPPELGQLSNLRKLTMHYNQLSGTIPPELGQLSNLESLWLADNQLSGTIPPELGQLSNLESLWLTVNELSGTIPPELGNLRRLQALYLYGNKLSGIPAELGNLGRLKELSLHSNRLSGSIPAELGNLSRLTSLELANNQLTGSIPPELGNLSNLTKLHLGDNRLTGSIPPELGNLSNLESLSLKYNELCGNIPLSLMNLTKILEPNPNQNPNLNLEDNHLTASSSELIAWLDKLNPDWASTQSSCPKPDCTVIGECENIDIGDAAAIIIAGGGSDDDNSLWDTTTATSNYIYKMLHKRGFGHEQIDYLSPQSYGDFDGDGLDDDIVDIPTTPRDLKVEDVREVFTRAKNRGKLNQPLYVFFNDHGTESRFVIAENTYLEVQDFKAILDDYQNETGNQLALVIDACYSGVLLEKLTAPNRAIISSTGDGLAYFDRSSKQGFSRFFAKGLLKGMNFYEAFGSARNEQTKLVNSISIDFEQNPQWHDGTTNGQWLQDIFINGDFTVGDITLTVWAITPSNQELSADGTLPLMAKISLAQGTVEKAWALLKPPKINFVLDSYGTPILSFPRLKLSPTQEENVWASTWGDAVYNGEYEIIFYAQDNQGNIASSEAITINVIGGVESPEASSVQIEVEKENYNLGVPFQARLIEELPWGYDLYVAVVMPDGNFLALTKKNEFAPINSVAKWDKIRKPHTPVMLLDLTLPDNLPIGEYCLYGILSPENESVWETVDSWEWTWRCFEVQK